VLHITNGDSAAQAIAGAGPGEVIPWRDVLHEGPVPAVNPAELRGVRARFLAEAGWADGAEAAAGFAARDAALERGAAEAQEIALWFERDLYDQLQLIQVLDRLAALRPAGRVSLVLVETLAGLGTEELRVLATTRRPVGPEAVAMARRAWRAFCDPDPTGLQPVADSANAAIPGLGTALYRHLEQFPWADDGLSRSERQALQAIAAGVRRPIDSFAAAQRREDRPFMGDVQFFAGLVAMAQEPAPLVTLSDPRWPDGFFGGQATLTDHGARVLARQADAVQLRGVDRWLGGVRLVGHEAAWRWDSARRTLQTGG
jgi:hypothetical protein